MDSPELETNALSINNIASVVFGIYKPADDQVLPFTISAHEIEVFLRANGHIACCDYSRRCIWLFRLPSKDEVPSTTPIHPDTLEIGGFKLMLFEDGRLEAGSLPRGRFASAPIGAGALNTPSSTPGMPLFDVSQQQRSQLVGSLSPGVSNAIDQRPAQNLAFGAKPPSSIPARIAYERFAFAIISSLSSSFCRRVGAVPLNHRSVLLDPKFRPDNAPGEPPLVQTPTLATFHAYLTTAGSFVLTLSLFVAEGLRHADDVFPRGTRPSNNHVFAAPLGVVARYQGPFDGNMPGLEHTAMPIPSAQPARFRREAEPGTSKWQKACIDLLTIKGVPQSLLRGCSWANLYIHRRKPVDQKYAGNRSQNIIHITWPSFLCFHKRSSPGNDALAGDYEGSYDFLSKIKSWVEAEHERDGKIVQRRRERESQAAYELVVAEAHEAQARELLLGIRGPLSNPAVQTMYPTPPDGLQSFGFGGISSIDSNLSSPTNAAAGAVPVAPLAASVNAVASTGIDSPSAAADPACAAGWVSTDNAKDQQLGDLLGDINIIESKGDDAFGDAAVTDADFNFFDVKPPATSKDPDPPRSAKAAVAEPFPVSSGPRPDVLVAAPSHVTDVAMQIPAKAEPGQPGKGVFAKPELRHARSTLPDRGRPEDYRQRSVKTKREPSPFTPDTVYKKVRASLTVRPSAARGYQRKGSVFEKVDFDPSLPLSSQKYGQNGYFGYNWTPYAHNLKIDATVPPSTGSMAKYQDKDKDKNKNFQALSAAFIRKVAGTSGASPLQHDLSRSGDDVSSLSGDETSDSGDASNADLDGVPSPSVPSVNKGHQMEDEVVPKVASTRNAEIHDDVDPVLTLELPRLCRGDTNEGFVMKYLTTPPALGLELRVSDEDCISIAQILAEQAALGRLEIPEGRLKSRSALSHLAARKQFAFALRRSLAAFQSIVSTVGLGEPSLCSLRGLLDIQDLIAPGQPNRLQSRTAPGRDPSAELMRLSNLYPISAPHLEVRRYDARLSVLPSAVAFWETLGLTPSQGTKDIQAVCVFPARNGLPEMVEAFLDDLRGVYESLKLGCFERLPLSNDSADGLCPFETKVDKAPPPHTGAAAAMVPPIPGSAVAGRMEGLVETLSSLATAEKTVVIFCVYSPRSPITIMEHCAAFQRLSRAYQRKVDPAKVANSELVLQLVSVDLVAVPDHLLITPQAELQRLCIETYDRCAMSGEPALSSAIILEQPPPRTIDFRPTTDPVESLLVENSCIHISYAQSVDDRWITAAWTDGRGSQQMTAAYCLCRKGRPQPTAMSEVAKAIWETTQDMMSSWKISWRVLITKSGPMTQAECEIWTGVVHADRASVSLTLLSVETNPSLQLIPPVARISTSSAAFYATPASTPQPSAASPEQSGSASTPTREAQAAASSTAGGIGAGGGDTQSIDGDDEPDAIIVDVTDQTWGAVLSHRLGNSPSASPDARPALISGYLIKRGGIHADDPPVVLEVNVVYSDVGLRAYEPLLREVLWEFRGLGTLARIRGIVDGVADVRPWHVAVAEKAAKALYILM